MVVGKVQGRFLVESTTESTPSPVLTTTVPLSFWGGIDEITGRVVDVSHPLHGTDIADCIFCLPSGRGSCTASQVLLELILNGKAPKAIVLRDVDGLLCVGALIAQEVFQKTSVDIADDTDNKVNNKDDIGSNVPDIICLGTDSYNRLVEANPSVGVVTHDGNFVYGDTDTEVKEVLEQANGIDGHHSGKDGRHQGENGINSVYDTTLQLTDEERSLIESSSTDAERMAWRVLIRYARVVSGTDYIGIAKGHIDGCTYIGPGGLAFVQRLVAAGGRVSVPTTLNSVSADRQQWKELGVPTEYAENSIALGDAYLALGCTPSFTCAPYLLDDPPSLGQDVCWGESNAVVFANSVLGARTEKYADYLDICAAIVGKTIATGVHLDEHREPQIVLDATKVLSEIQQRNKKDATLLDGLFPTLGHLCGTLSDGMVPILVGMEDWKDIVSIEHLKAFCAAFGTTGTSPLIHIAGITPEACDATDIDQWLRSPKMRKVTVGWDDLRTTFESLDSSPNEEQIDLIALGNPHLSITECQTLADLVDTDRNNQGEYNDKTRYQTKAESVRIIACMSRQLKESVPAPVMMRLERFGVEFISDTCWCMLLDPPVIPTNHEATILTNSGKYAHYGPGLTNRKFRFGTMQECIDSAVTGTLMSRTSATMPRWLLQKRTFTSTAKSLLRFTILKRF